VGVVILEYGKRVASFTPSPNPLPPWGGGLKIRLLQDAYRPAVPKSLFFKGGLSALPIFEAPLIFLKLGRQRTLAYLQKTLSEGKALVAQVFNLCQTT
jgi:hypothetical protein